MQNLNIKFFGLGIFKYKTQKGSDGFPVINYKDKWERQYPEDYKNDEPFDETKPYTTEHHLFLYLDFGKKMTTNIVFWKGVYKAKWAMKRIETICTNAGQALMVFNDKKQIKAVRELSQFKVDFFGAEDIPIRNLSAAEYENYFSEVNPRSDNFCKMFKNSNLNT